LYFFRVCTSYTPKVIIHVVLNVHLWSVFQMPTFAPLGLNGDSKWHANINAFLSDHNPSRVMDFYCIFKNDRGLHAASNPSGGGNGSRNGGVGGSTKDLSIYLGIGDVPKQSLWSRFLQYLGTTRETLSPLRFSYFLTIKLPQCYNNVMNQVSLLIIDWGTSVCIFPHRSDFITYTTS
jgi:hypothetical protein